MGVENCGTLDKLHVTRGEIVVDASRNRESVRRWYAAHSKEYNSKRRQAYANDPDLRAKAQQRAKEYRAKRAEGKKIERVLTRIVNGVEQEVFSSGYAAQQIGKTPQSLRAWETKGWLPKPTIEGKHRLYTYGQVAWVGALNTFLDSVGGARKVTEENSKDFLTMLHREWDA